MARVKTTQQLIDLADSLRVKNAKYEREWPDKVMMFVIPILFVFMILGGILFRCGLQTIGNYLAIIAYTLMISLFLISSIGMIYLLLKKIGFKKRFGEDIRKDEDDMHKLDAYPKSELEALLEHTNRHIEMLTKRREISTWMIGLISSFYFIEKEATNVFTAPQAAWIKNAYTILRDVVQLPMLMTSFAGALIVAGLFVHIRQEQLQRVGFLIKNVVEDRK